MALNHVGLDKTTSDIKQGVCPLLWKSSCVNIECKSSTVDASSLNVRLLYFGLLCRCPLIKSTALSITCIDLTLRDWGGPRRGIAAEQRRLPTALRPESKFKSACAAGKRGASSVPDADVFRLQARPPTAADSASARTWKQRWSRVLVVGGGEFFDVYRRKRQLQVALKCLLGRSWMRTSLPLSMIYINLAISAEALGSHCSGPKKEEREERRKEQAPMYNYKTNSCHL